MQHPSVFGIPVDFILFGLTLAGVAVFHKCTMCAALMGLVTIIIYIIAFTGIKTGEGVMGFISHVGHEWVILVNLLCLLLGFALLSQHFEKSQLPLALPRFLPHDWKGCFVLLVIVFVLSSFLDNIAAALIGGAMAHTLFRGKVHIGYLAAIVAASNAGGSGSMVGDTTTTMMWIDGVHPLGAYWVVLAESFACSIFLLSLVTAATMMSVEKLPAASWHTAMGFGVVSAVFDNSPLAALALKQGGYDWGYLAYAVGFGGSMIWFGSSAGVALANMYPQAKSVGLWLKHGWHVAVAYVVGFFVLYAVLGWHPNPPHKAAPAATSYSTS